MILEDLPVREFWRSSGEDESDFFADLDVLAAARGVPVRVLEAGETIDREGREDYRRCIRAAARRKVDAINNQSLVFLFERDGRSALLTGDASAATEESSCGSAGSPGRTSSRSATTAAGARRRRPSSKRSARAPPVISCGRENRFGHPAPRPCRRSPPPASPSSGQISLPTSGSNSSRMSTHLAWRGLQVSRLPRGRRCSSWLGPTGSGKSDAAHADRAGARRGDRLGRRLRGLPGLRHRDGEARAAGAERSPLSPDRRRRSRRELLGGAVGGEARQAIEEIGRRGRLPIVCGGSGFYVEALLKGLPLPERRRSPAGALPWPRGVRRIPPPPAAFSRSTIPSPREGSLPRTCGTSCERSRSCSKPELPPRQGRVPAADCPSAGE